MTLPPSSATKPAASRGTLLLAGFYGRGNAGDEALLQCMCEALEDAFDIAIAVDEHGAYPGFWDWYPYVGRRIVHQQDLGFLHRTPGLRGVLVGGGGLPLGFAADLLMEAAARGVPVAVAGVDTAAGSNTLARLHPALSRGYRDMLSFFMVRSAASAAAAEALGLRPLLGGDLALRLPTDAAADVCEDPARALVVVREWSWDERGRAHAEEARALLRTLEGAGYAPTFLPFAPEDVRFLGEAGLATLAPTIESWWNPRRLKQLIAASGLLVTIGRLHPIVFAATTATPVAAIGVPPLHGHGQRTPPKLRHMAADLGIACFEALDPLHEAIRARAIRPADPALVAAAVARLDHSLTALRRVLGAPPA